MRALALLLTSILLLAACAEREERQVITKEALEEMFQGMQQNGAWDLSGPLLWGYFFTDESPEKLRDASVLLEKQGYRVVDIYPAETEDSAEAPYWWLHVEKVEHHTVDSLHRRNDDLYAFAAENDLGTYDGMDVGAVESKH